MIKMSISVLICFAFQSKGLSLFGIFVITVVGEGCLCICFYYFPSLGNTNRLSEWDQGLKILC